MVETLTGAGIDTDRIHIPKRPKGIEFLNGGFLGRLFGDEQRDLQIELLDDGASLVRILCVADVDNDDVAATAGVQVIRRYGKWTYG